MNKKQVILGLLALVAMGANAQDIAIQNKGIDCGQVLFKHPLTTQFVMKNSGTKPLIIRDVRTSCGCTAVSYPRGSVAPGATFTVSAVYDAKTLGHFNKQIAVFSNASADPFMLSVKGVVVEEPEQHHVNYAMLSLMT